MASNLIEQVKEIEARADGIVQEARRKARQIEQSAGADAKALREEYEGAFKQAIEAFKAEEERRASDEQAQLDVKAGAIGERLDSINPAAATSAVELVLKHLRGD